MTNHFHERLEELFHDLVDLSAEERAPRLEALEAEEPEIVTALRRLLAADDTTDAELPPIELPVEDKSEDGRQIGPYQVLRKLGEGGMGEVWEALQERPVKRRVALKLLPRDRSSQSVRRRFDAERQALAMLDHPNIASFYESGTTEEGEPWFAMELVRGLPLTEFCDEEALSLDDRLLLFESLCEAVQHAHRRGLIHRDLKPSNVIVAWRAGDGAVADTDAGAAAAVAARGSGPPRLVVIDFGIAKALPESSLEMGQTLHGDVLGTPEYMSPEQAGSEDGIVDTRTDVYALGVILYELLVGELPVSADALRQAGIDEMRRRIREDEAPRPSSRLTEFNEDHTTEVARRRSTHPSVLIRRLRGDLDWIVLKALAKSKAQRYESPLALADDLRRLLAGHTVRARPPTWHYRAGKWVKRHRAVAVVLAVVSLTSATAAVLVSTALVRARAAEQTARLEAEQERATREFLVQLFEANDPYARDPWTGANSTTSQLTGLEILERGADRLVGEMVTDPMTRARLQVTVGRLYQQLAEDERAAALLESALESLEGLESADAAVTRSSRAGIVSGRVDALLSLGDLHLATGEQERALQRYREASKSAPAGSAQRAHAEAALAEALRVGAQLDAALEAAQRAVDTARALIEPASGRKLEPATQATHEAHERSLWVLAAVNTDRGAATEAVAAYRFLAEAQEQRLGGEHPRLASTYRGLSNALEVAGDYAAGGVAAQRALQISRATLGDAHPVVAYDLLQVGSSNRLRAQHAEAVVLLREAETILRAARPNSLSLATTLAELGMSLEELGQLEESAAAHQESMELSAAVHGPDHPEVGAALSRLSSALRAAGRVQEALPHARRALQIAEAAHPEGHWRVIFGLAEVTQVLEALGDLTAARRRAEEMMEIAFRVLGADHVLTAAAETIEAQVLIQVAVDRGSPELLGEAESSLAHARAVFTEQQGAQSPNLQHIAKLERLLADARSDLGVD